MSLYPKPRLGAQQWYSDVYDIFESWVFNHEIVFYFQTVSSPVTSRTQPIPSLTWIPAMFSWKKFQNDEQTSEMNDCVYSLQSRLNENTLVQSLRKRLLYLMPWHRRSLEWCFHFLQLRFLRLRHGYWSWRSDHWRNAKLIANHMN